MCGLELMYDRTESFSLESNEDSFMAFWRNISTESSLLPWPGAAPGTLSAERDEFVR